MAEEAELAFVARMRDEASAVARQARRTLDSVGGKTAPIETDLRVRDGVSATLRNVSTRLDEVSRKTIDTGQTLTKSLTLPIVGMGLAVGKASIDFSRGMGDVASLLPGNTARVDELRASVMRIGPEAGASLGDVSKGLYQTLSAFGDTADTAKILELNAKSARAGAASVADAINLTSAVTKAYGNTTAKAVTHASDLALLTVRLGQTTFPELAGSVGMVTPLTKALGASQEELFATMATFTGVTGGASEVSTQLRGALQSLMAPTADATKAIHAAGYSSGEAAVKHEGLEGAIGILTSAADKSGKPLQSYISSIEGQVIALGLAGPQADAYRKNLEEMGHASGATADAFEASTTGAGEQAFQWDKAKVEAEKLLVTLGDGLGPAVLDLVDALRPAARQVGEWAQAFADADPQTQKLVATAIALAAAIGPLLIVLGSVGRGVSGLIGGVASASGAMSKGSTAAKGYVTNLRSAETRTRALGQAARVAAGAAGMLMLADASQKTGTKMGAFEDVLGGVATGFAMGGPIGGLVGLFGGVAKATLDLTDPTEELAAAQAELGVTYAGVKSKARDYASTLDETTGAITRMTKAEILQAAQEEGVLGLFNRRGVATRDLIGSVLGQTGATNRMNRALGQTRGELTGLEEVKLNEWLAVNTRGFALQQNQIRQNARDLRSWKQATKGLPPKLVTELKQIGADMSMRQLKRLRREYGLNPKQVRTMIEAVGTEATIRKVNGVWRVFEDGKRVRPNLDAWQSDLANAIGQGGKAAARGGAQVKGGLEGPIRSTRPDLSSLIGGIDTGVATAKSHASSGGSGVGSNLKAGILAGFAGAASQLATEAYNAVSNAIAAGHRAADAHSPSRKTMALGKDLGDGLRIGLRKTAKGNADEARKLVGSILGVMLRDLVGTSEEVEKGLGRIDKALEARTDHRIHALERQEKAVRKHSSGKEEARRIKALTRQEAAARKHGAAVVKALRDEEAAVRKNANAYDVLRGKLKAAHETGAAFAQTLKDYASVASFQPVNEAPVTAGFLVKDLADRLKAIRAFRADLQELRDRGVAKDVIHDLEAQGVEAGAASAAALAGATNEQLREINRLSGEINDTADTAGAESVRGLVRGITNQLSAVDAVGRRLARRLRSAIRKELGIKSPSTRLAEDGRDAARGLGGGILEEARYAERAAASMADRVAAAAIPTLPDLARMSNAAALRPLVVRSSEVLVIRHEVTSPDGSVDDLTAAQVADLIARDPRSARGIEDALSRHRARRAGNTIRSTGR